MIELFKLQNSTASEIENDLSVYPNPNNGVSTILYNVPSSGNITIELYNVIGDLILSLNETNDAGRHTYPLDIKKLNAGVYLLKSTINGVNKTTKIVKYN